MVEIMIWSKEELKEMGNWQKMDSRNQQSTLILQKKNQFRIHCPNPN